MEAFQKCGNRNTRWPNSMFFIINPKNILQRNPHIHINRTIFTIYKWRNQPNCPLTEEWTKMWYMHTMEFYLIFKKKWGFHFGMKISQHLTQRIRCPFPSWRPSKPPNWKWNSEWGLEQTKQTSASCRGWLNRQRWYKRSLLQCSLRDKCKAWHRLPKKEWFWTHWRKMLHISLHEEYVKKLQKS